MAPTLVRWYSGANSAPATTLAAATATPAGVPAAGNLLVACVAYAQSVGLVVSAPGFTTDGEANVVGWTGHQVLHGPATGLEPGGVPTFTLSGAQRAAALVLEFAAADPAPKDVAAAAAQMTTLLSYAASPVTPTIRDLVLFFA